jgi:hypothetical protein
MLALRPLRAAQCHGANVIAEGLDRAVGAGTEQKKREEEWAERSIRVSRQIACVCVGVCWIVSFVQLLLLLLFLVFSLARSC